MARLSITLLVLVCGCLLINELDGKRMIRVRPIRQKVHNTVYQQNTQINYHCHCLGINNSSNLNSFRGHRGRDRMVVGFTNTYAISAYHY
jgi:hypothetical protein